MGRLIVWMGLWLSVNTWAQAPVAVPPALEPWREWVLHDHPDRHCPFLHDKAQRSCVWPSQLMLDLRSQGGEFDFRVDTFADAWVALPGSDALWPEQVRDQGRVIQVVRREGKPQVYLPAGQYRLRGLWRWSTLPRTLPIPEHAGLIQLRLDGQPVASPTRASAGELWLRAQQPQQQAPAGDALDIRVFRRLQDSNPALLETLVQLAVSGREREVLTGPLLLPGWTPRLMTSDLAARVESDGRLRVQLQPGRWEIRLVAHQLSPPQSLTYTPADDLWPQQEVWAFAAEPRLRTVQLEGLPTLDASQTQMPGDWRHLPTYLATPGTELQLRELHRGDPTPPANRLSLDKTLWLDFAGRQFTVRDRLSGTLSESRRLDAVAGYHLGRAELNGQPLLITRRDDAPGHGIEIRERNFELETVSRLTRQGSLPVAGWQTAVQRVDTTLNLPPGWSLLHASGADRVTGSWVGQWTLWNLFLVLVIAVAIGRTTHPALGLLTFVTLTLTFQRSGAPLSVWLNFAAVFALLPFVHGRGRVWLQRYAWLSFAALLLILLPYAVDNARMALYLQLERAEQPPETFYDMSPAPPPMAASAPAMVRSRELAKDAMLEEVVVSGIRVSREERYLVDQNIQAGPGLPDWQWHRVQLSWSGPVMADEQTRLYLVPPWLNRLGYMLAILLPLLLAAALLRRFSQAEGSWRDWSGLVKGAPAAVLLAAVIGLPTPADANVVVDKELLNTLRQRLLAPPPCLPECVAIESVQVRGSEEQLRVVMQLHAATDLAMPLPAQVAGWYPSQVQVNGRDADWLQNRDGHLAVRLPPGSHQVMLQGALQGLDQVHLPFATQLHNVSIELPGWRATGLPGAQQASRALQLQREQRDVREGAQRLLPDPMPPFVLLRRQLHIGVDWTLHTQVLRQAPSQGAIELLVPLVPGEAPNSGEVRDGSMVVRMAAQQSNVSWQSTIKPFEALTLVAPRGQPWTEVWEVSASPIWHLRESGLAPVAGEPNLWQPWPGESLTLEVSRPVAVEGDQLSIDSVQLRQTLGKRADTVALELTLRATQGLDYDLQLPEAVHIERILVDGRVTPLSHNRNLLKLPLRPGEQRLLVEWRNDRDGGVLQATPSMDLGHSASNLRLNMSLPQDRWLLWVSGPAIGPAILFWGVLIVVLLLAVALARSGWTPLKTYEWLLLSLGVATFNLYVLVLIAAWMLALYWRGRRREPANTKHFNLLQVALFALSAITLLALISSIPASLLSRPDMMVVGNGSSAHHLQWYQDRSDAQLPTAWTFSLPLLVYRLAMLVWSLWLAFALMRWIRWAWLQLGVQGYWFSKPPKTQAAPTVPAPTDPQPDSPPELPKT